MRNTNLDQNSSQIFYALAAYFQDIDADCDLQVISDIAATAVAMGFESENHYGNTFTHEDGRILVVNHLEEIIIRKGKARGAREIMATVAFLNLN